MSFIFKICPCLTWVLKRKPESPSKKYDGVNQLQQQQFMHHLQNQAIRLDAETDRVNQHNIQQQLNVQLGLNKSQFIQQTSHKQKKLQQKPQVQVLQDTELINLNEQKKISFKLIWPEYDEYYNILSEATKDIPQILSQQEYSQISLPNQQLLKSKLKAWGKTNVKGGKFIFDFQLPCSYSYYQHICSKKINPKDNKVINQYRHIQTLKSNLSVKYICLNKISMLQPRDFTYLKYTNGIQDQHWQVCISKQDFHPQQTKARIGKIHLVSRITQNDQIIRIRTFLNLDLNGNIIENMWGKIYNQSVIYIQGLWKQASDNYQKQLV